jgi:hypothetical protein
MLHDCCFLWMLSETWHPLHNRLKRWNLLSKNNLEFLSKSITVMFSFLTFFISLISKWSSKIDNFLASNSQIPHVVLHLMLLLLRPYLHPGIHISPRYETMVFYKMLCSSIFYHGSDFIWFPGSWPCFRYDQANTGPEETAAEDSISIHTDTDVYALDDC